MKINITVVLLILGAYFLSTGISYAAFSALSAKDSGLKSPAADKSKITPVSKASKFKLDPQIPKEEVCPLNGALYTKKEKDLWETRRPLVVMIENHQDARPQSGLSLSDVVYEAVAEGGITRFAAVYYCTAAAFDVQIGPVRSARTYFLDFASEYGDKPLYAHIGGANTDGPADALSQIEDYGWAGINDLNQFSIGYPVFWRDYERLGREVNTEHTMYSTTNKLWQYAADKRLLTNVDKKGKEWDTAFVSWKFKDETAKEKRPETQTIGLNFWSGYNDYAVRWIYDKNTNVYMRENGGQPHIDLDTDEQLYSKTVIIQFMTEKNADDGYENNAHMLYGTKGSGRTLIFQDGTVTEGKWQKTKRTDRTIFVDSKGKEVSFNRGRLWVEILPIGATVSY